MRIIFKKFEFEEIEELGGNPSGILSCLMGLGRGLVKRVFCKSKSSSIGARDGNVCLMSLNLNSKLFFIEFSAV